MRIEEISKQRLANATDLELKQLKFKFAKFWDRHFKNNNRDIVGTFTRSGFISKYRLLLKEMDSSKRSLEHSTCDIDRKAFKQSMEVKQAGIDIGQLSRVITHRNYILLDKDFAKVDEIKITIQSKDEPDQLLEDEISKMLSEQFNKPCTFIYQVDFEGDAIPLFHKVLSPTTKIEKIELKSEKKETEIEKDIEIIPVEKGDEHIVYGIVYEPDTIDAQGDEADAGEIQKAAYDFMEHVQTFKIMHKGNKVKVRILENYIAPVDFTIEKRKVKKGSWVLVTRILDKKLWTEIKAGKLTGYSMAGYAQVG